MEGEVAEISIVAEGNANPIVLYEWYNSSDEMVVSGTDTDSLVFDPAGVNDSGLYYCVLTNNQGKQTTSEPAELSVIGTLLKFDFENDLTDTAGNFDGAAMNIDPNFAGGNSI